MVGDYHGSELVVDLKDLVMVQHELNSLKVLSATDPKRSSSLNLALVKLEDLDSAIKPLKEELLEAAGSDSGGPYNLAMNSPDIDFLIFHLRRQLRDWSPTIGKNRLVGGVEGAPHTGGAARIPVVLAAGESFELQRRVPALAKRIRIGVLDTPIFAHSDLLGRYLADSDAFLSGQAIPYSSAGHATFIAGLIQEQAPNADLVVRQVLDDHAVSVWSWDVATRMVAFLNEDVAILNISFGCATDDNQPPLLLKRVVEKLTPTITVVAAAGNHGELPDNPPNQDPDTPQLTSKTTIWPAALGDVVAVGALRKSVGTEPAPQASFSPRLPWIDLLALGEDVISTYLSNNVHVVGRDPSGNPIDNGVQQFGDPGYAKWSGTSFAAARVSGAIAMRAEAQRVSVRESLNRFMDPSLNPNPTAVEPSSDIRPFTVGDL
jgi:hypothetical protein